MELKLFEDFFEGFEKQGLNANLFPTENGYSEFKRDVLEKAKRSIDEGVSEEVSFQLFLIAFENVLQDMMLGIIESLLDSLNESLGIDRKSTLS